MTSPRPRESNYICPVCKRPMLSAAERCSGSFLDTNHPSNVAPIKQNEDDQ